MIQTCENGKKPNFMPNFGPSGPNLGSQKKFFVSFTPTNS